MSGVSDLPRGRIQNTVDLTGKFGANGNQKLGIPEDSPSAVLALSVSGTSRS